MEDRFIILNRVGLVERVTFEGRLERSEEVDQKDMLIWGKSILDKGNSQWKCPEVGILKNKTKQPLLYRRKISLLREISEARNTWCCSATYIVQFST